MQRRIVKDPSHSTARVQSRQTQAERRGASERKLLLATAELIVDRGLESASLSAIASRAGVSHSLVTHLFGSKLGMIERLNELVDEFYRSSINRVPGGTGLETLTELAEQYLRLTTGPDPLGRVHLVLWTEAIARTSEIRSSRIDWDRHFRRSIAGLISQGISDGSISGQIEPKTTSLVIVGLLRGAALQLILDERAGTLADVGKTTVRMISTVLGGKQL
jgi:AcrR family transcriptional regulator